MPLFRIKKEPFEWLASSKKTIDVRKGNPHEGEVAVYLSGRRTADEVVKRESGRLAEIVRSDNYKQVIPSAVVVDDALAYLRVLYDGYEGIFTAYYIVPFES